MAHILAIISYIRVLSGTDLCQHQDDERASNSGNYRRRIKRSKPAAEAAAPLLTYQDALKMAIDGRCVLHRTPSAMFARTPERRGAVPRLAS